MYERIKYVLYGMIAALSALVLGFACKYAYSWKRQRYHAEATRVWEVTQDIFYFLTRLLEPYIYPIELNDLNIIISDLDLKSGTSSSGAHVLVKPYPTEQLRWALRKNASFHTYEPKPRRFPTNVTEAEEISKYLEKCVHWLDNKTSWGTRRSDWELGERLELRNDRWDFNVRVICDKEDLVTPHVSPVLADNARMEEAYPSRAELCCIILCTVARLRVKQYHCHQIIPVTVASISGYSARIIHGYVDHEAKALRVFKSPIMNLAGLDRTPNIETLLSWCVGEPTGPTKWYHTSKMEKLLSWWIRPSSEPTRLYSFPDLE